MYILKAETFTHVAIQSFTMWLSYCIAHDNSWTIADNCNFQSIVQPL